MSRQRKDMATREKYTGFRAGRNATSDNTNQWLELLKSPLAQQALALLLIVLALLTALALFKITSGSWTDAWLGFLQRVIGWGVIPFTFFLGYAGVLVLQNQLEKEIKLRWRPIVGSEMVFFSLLALTHLLLGQNDSWQLVESGWGGGLVGWAISTQLTTYIGTLPSGAIMILVLVFGIGLAFDVTIKDLQNVTSATRSRMPQTRSASHTSRRKQPVEPRPTPSPQTSPPATEQRPTPAPTTPARSTPAPRPEPQPTAAPATPTSSAPLPLTTVMAETEFRLPSLELLERGDESEPDDADIRRKSQTITDTLEQFGLPVRVVEVRRGPTVTQFGIEPGFTNRVTSGGQHKSQKVRVSQITALANDLALALAASSLRVEAPVPGRPVVGIEVPNEEVALITLRTVMESDDFQSLDSPLAVALGHNVAGEAVVADLGLMPHLLIAGTTGSGKSISIKSLATCLAMSNSPNDLRLVMIDPKMVELVRFNGLPHLLGHTEYELDRIIRVLRWVAHEMDQRYKEFSNLGARHLDDYNAQVRQRQPEKQRPRIVVIIDELADLMMMAPEQTERTICRIAQMARATGIHLVVATQRPSVDVVTGLIKANFPARISFATASQVDSRVILDTPGADTLLGRGDMLYLASDASHPERVQGCFVSEQEIQALVEFWQDQAPDWPSDPPWERMIQAPPDEGPSPMTEEDDNVLQQALELVQRRKTISASYLQRQLRIGYPRAARIIEQLEELGMVGPQESAGRPRKVIGGESD